MTREASRLWRSVCLPVLLLASLAAPAAAACDPDGVQASGAVYRICMPAGPWNGHLVVWAHGYVNFNEPVAIPENQLRLPDGSSLPDLITSQGYAFATTSYSVNGLAVRQGLADVVDLVQVFAAAKGRARFVYLVGASEGGLITTLGIERFPQVFSAGVAICGPIGNFAQQVNYFGDFRVLFDYFYPGLLPGTPTNVPADLIANWPTYYATVVRPIVFSPANAQRTRQLIATARLPTDPFDFWPTAEQSIADGLRYAVFATNDADEKLGGQPFDNRHRLYVGSSNDLRLNLLVRRIAAEPAALREMRAQYDTTGVLRRPLITLHTLLDQQVPYWHEPLYLTKVLAAGSLLNFAHIPAARYGHCNVTAEEALVAFGLAVLRTEGLSLRDPAAALDANPDALAAFDRLAATHGLAPRRTP